MTENALVPTISSVRWRTLSPLLLATLALLLGACASSPRAATTPNPAAVRDSVARDSSSRAAAREAARAEARRRDEARREAARRESALRDSATVARRDSIERVARAERAARDRRVAERARIDRRAAAARASRRPLRAGEVRFCAGGDVSLGTNIDTSWTALAASRVGHAVRALPDPDSVLLAIRPLVDGADVVLLNVEGAVGEGPAPRKCGPRSTGCFALRQPAATAAALRRFGGDAVTVGNVANNHARDAGLDGFSETRRRLEDAGVIVAGADTLPALAVTARGDTVAFLGFSTSAIPDARDTIAVRRHVARAAALYPRVVVTMHLGAEGSGAQHTRDGAERYMGGTRGNPVAFARAALAGGAGLVVGHGPHVVRALEWRGDRLVVYSLGNLATYGPFALRDPMDRGAVFCATLGPDGRPTDATLASTRQRLPGVPEPDPDARAARLADQLGRADFPASGARVGVDGEIRPPR